MGWLDLSDRERSIIDMSRRDVTPSASVSGYEGATTGRRISATWASSAGPNTLLRSSVANLRRRSRALARDNPFASNAVEKWAANLVGTGILPRWVIDNGDLKAELHQLWEDWTDESDADGIADFYGQQNLVARSVVEAGEVLVRFRPRRAEDRLTVPLQLQLIESDHLDETFNSIAPNGNRIQMGIEIDALGRRAAYWLFREHPGEQYPMTGGTERVRIPASEILHVYKATRPGQLRGLPWLSSIILRLHELDQYEDAELVRKKGAAMICGFIKESLGEATMDNPLIGQPGGTDAAGNTVVQLEPGTFPALPPGAEIQFATPADVGDTYLPFIQQNLRAIAIGMGLTYEQLTGDLSQVNYSSIRAGLLEFRRLCESIQWHVLVYQFCRPVVLRWLDVAVLSGAVNLPGYYRSPRQYRRVEWKTPGWPWVDPDSEVKADLLAVQSGFKSRSAVIAERGDIPEIVYRQLEEDNRMADEHNLTLQSDLRKVNKEGSVQEELSEAPPVKPGKQEMKRQRGRND